MNHFSHKTKYTRFISSIDAFSERKSKITKFHPNEITIAKYKQE